ncbi:hypothetical protein K501DRAFT_199971, partial [Backusella circina FSU 941]
IHPHNDPLLFPGSAYTCYCQTIATSSTLHPHSTMARVFLIPLLRSFRDHE